MGRSRLLTTRITVLAALGIALGLGCASVVRGPVRYEFFSTPRSDDPWTPKIASWQIRELASSAAEKPVSVSGAGAAADEAEDLAQETFLKMFRARTSYQARERFTAYAYRVARNAWVDRARRRAVAGPVGRGGGRFRR